jgi:hypothetical protein
MGKFNTAFGELAKSGAMDFQDESGQPLTKERNAAVGRVAGNAILGTTVENAALKSDLDTILGRSAETQQAVRSAPNTSTRQGTIGSSTVPLQTTQSVEPRNQTNRNQSVGGIGRVQRASLLGG